MRVSRSSLPLGAWESPPRLLRLQLPTPESLRGSQRPTQPVSPSVSLGSCLSAPLGVVDVNCVTEDPHTSGTPFLFLHWLQGLRPHTVPRGSILVCCLPVFEQALPGVSLSR